MLDCSQSENDTIVVEQTGNRLQAEIPSLQAGERISIRISANLESDLNAGDEVVMKKIGTGTVTVASTTIESSNQTITITNNQPIRCLYVNSTVGWLIT